MPTGSWPHDTHTLPPHGRGQPVQVGDGLRIEPQHRRDRVEHLGRRRPVTPLLQARVVGRADPGEKGELFPSQPALTWALRRTEVAAVITGASRPEQVHANAAASGIALDASTLTAVDEALGDAAVTEPLPAMYVESGVLRR